MRSITLSLIRRNLRSYAASRLTYKQQPSCLLASPLQRKFLQEEDPSRTPLLFQFRFASSSAVAEKVGDDEKLKRMLESKIECADETGGFQPNGFPFQITHKCRKQIITFKRDFAGENIEVQVHMPEDVGADEASGKTRILLFVNISKGKRPGPVFCCSTQSDEITIYSVEMPNAPASSDKVIDERIEFSDLDENLQKEFYKYLEVRGIKSSLINFLREHMIYKDNKDYLRWLKNMKDFIE